MRLLDVIFPRHFSRLKVQPVLCIHVSTSHNSTNHRLEIFLKIESVLGVQFFLIIILSM